MEITEKLVRFLNDRKKSRCAKIIKSGQVKLDFVDVADLGNRDWGIYYATILISGKYYDTIKEEEKKMIEESLDKIAEKEEITIRNLSWNMYTSDDKKGKTIIERVKSYWIWGPILFILGILAQLSDCTGYNLKDWIETPKKEVESSPKINNEVKITGENIKDIISGNETVTINNNYSTGVTKNPESDKINSNVNQSRINDKRDGNHYSTIKLGGNIWLTENLKYILPNGNSYCYEDNPINCDIYGRLYQWNDVKKACPEGWRLPTIAEWRQLGNSFGGLNEGDNLPENVRKSYDVLKKGGQSGFDLLASGVRLIYKNEPSYYGVIEEGYYWSSDTRESDNIQVFFINANDGEIEINVEPKNRWLPCRCIKK